jgi:hypothetical protein
MPKRSSKPGDVNRLAAAIVGEATDERDPLAVEPERDPLDAPREKDPAAVALGRRGGLKGGVARAASLSPAQRKESAEKAAAARWGQRRPDDVK